MENQRPLVSLVCAACVAEEPLAEFHGALFRGLRALESGYRFEILYVANSRGGLDRIEALAQLDTRVRVLPQETDAASGDRAVRAGLEHAKGDLVITLDAGLHPPELVGRLLEQARNSCDIVLAVAGERRSSSWLDRLRPGRAAARDAASVLLKRPAADAVRALRDNPRSLEDLVLATGLPLVEVAYSPTLRRAAPGIGVIRRVVGGGLLVWRRDPLGLVQAFGATVFALGIFLACWFTLQGLIVPNSVWFSWGYLIVLLHILGGSMLYALGKVGALAQRILQHLEGDATASQDDSEAHAAASVIQLQTKNAA